MPRDDVMGLMKSLKFVGMPKAYDEVLAAGRKRRQTTETIIVVASARWEEGSKHCKRGSWTPINASYIYLDGSATF